MMWYDGHKIRRMPGRNVPETTFARKPRTRRGKYFRTIKSGAVVGRKHYRAAVTVEHRNGMRETACPLGPMRQTRFQAKKLLRRAAASVDHAYLWVEQAIL
jgi:hypothetical protein